MRRCFNIDYPVREDYNDQGVRVRVVTLPPVECGAVATLRSTVVWPGNGSKQHTYTCEEHADKLRTLTTKAGFPWDPKPYSPNK